MGLGGILVPVGLRNKALGGEFMLTTSQVGPNFFIGNNAEANGLYMPLGKFRGNVSYERQDAAELAEADLGRSLTSGEVSRYWLDRSVAYIQENPGHWFRLMLKKWLLVWNSVEVGDTESIEAYRDSSSVLRILGWGSHFGVILPLAVVGAWQTRDRWRHLVLLYGVALCMALAVTLFFVFARYRHPMTAVLVLFAAGGLWELVKLIRHREAPALAGCLVLLVASGIVSNHRMLPEMYGFGAITYANLGSNLADAGRLEEAAVYQRKALALSPDLGHAHYGLGIVLGKQGDFEGAAKHLKRVVDLHPDNVDAHYFLAIAQRRRGDTDAAVRHLQRAVALDPSHVEAHNGLGSILSQQYRLDEAIQYFKKAVELDPAHADAHYNLGSELARRGNLDEAARHMQLALTLNPERVEAHNKFGTILNRQRRFDEAIQHFRKAVELDPGHADAHYNLGGALARKGDFNQARHHLENVLRINPGDTGAAELLAYVLSHLGKS